MPDAPAGAGEAEDPSDLEAEVESSDEEWLPGGSGVTLAEGGSRQKARPRPEWGYPPRGLRIPGKMGFSLQTPVATTPR
jgi:hypothetical protein